MYTIDADRSQGLISVKIWGTMSLDEVACYVADVKSAIVSNGMVRYAMVIDVSESPFQSQATMRAMGEHIASMPKALSLAIVTGQSPSRMQARRLFTQSYARMTTSVAEGRAWVIDGIEPKPERAAA